MQWDNKRTILENKLSAVEHELECTIKSKNILTLNNHTKDEKLKEYADTLAEKDARIRKQRAKLSKAGQLIEAGKARIAHQRTRLLALELQIHKLKDEEFKKYPTIKSWIKDLSFSQGVKVLLSAVVACLITYAIVTCL